MALILNQWQNLVKVRKSLRPFPNDYKDITKEFLSFLCVDKNEVFKLDRKAIDVYGKKKYVESWPGYLRPVELSPEEEQMTMKDLMFPSLRIKQIGIIIAGGIGVGKSTCADFLAHAIKIYWEEDPNYKPIETNISKSSSSIDALIECAFRDTFAPIQVIIFDDETCVPLELKKAPKFFAMRHRMAEETGLDEGIIYCIYLAHDWYRLDPTFRRNASASIFLSVPQLDRYSKQVYSAYIGPERYNKVSPFEWLSNLTALKFREDEPYKKYGLLNFMGHIGVFKFPQARPQATIINEIIQWREKRKYERPLVKETYYETILPLRENDFATKEEVDRIRRSLLEHQTKIIPQKRRWRIW